MYQSRRDRQRKRIIILMVAVFIALGAGYLAGAAIGAIEQAQVEQRLRDHITELEGRVEFYRTQIADGVRFIRGEV